MSARKFAISPATCCISLRRLLSSCSRCASQTPWHKMWRGGSSGGAGGEEKEQGGAYQRALPREVLLKLLEALLQLVVHRGRAAGRAQLRALARSCRRSAPAPPPTPAGPTGKNQACAGSISRGACPGRFHAGCKGPRVIILGGPTLCTASGCWGPARSVGASLSPSQQSQSSLLATFIIRSKQSSRGARYERTEVRCDAPPRSEKMRRAF
jgi:hypothetical protein